MTLRETLLAALLECFRDREMRVGTARDAVVPAAYGDLIARFPAKHPEVGDVSILGTGNLNPARDDAVLSAAVSVGEIIVQYSFNNYDSHLASHERALRVTRDVVRFLQELFADRLLFWKSTDGRSAGWRERGDTGHSEPLVMDDRPYSLYLWSGPLSVWQATPNILARGRIADDREHHLVLHRLNASGQEGFHGSDRELARRLIADYELGHGN